MKEKLLLRIILMTLEWGCKDKEGRTPDTLVTGIYLGCRRSCLANPSASSEKWAVF